MSDDNSKRSKPAAEAESRPLPPARVRVRKSPPAAEAPKQAKSAYEVGYRKPPKRHQFQPGKSGNPRGRPKGSKSLSTLVDEALSRKIKVKIGGRTLNITQREALVLQYVDKAMRGDHKAFAVLMKLDPKAREADRDGQSSAQAELSPEEIAILLAFLKTNADGEVE